MRILFTSTPASEHNVLVPIALAAVEAGHEVAFAAAEPRRQSVEQLGFRFYPLDWPDPAAQAELGTYIRSFPTLKERFVASRRAGFAGQLVEAYLGGVMEACSEWKPDVVVRHSLELAASLAAEALGIPHAVVNVQAWGDEVYARDAIVEPMNEWRTKLGLQPDADLSMLERYLTLIPFPRSYHPPGKPFPATAHHLRPGVFDSAGEPKLPEWFASLPDQPVVHVTFGTFFNTSDGGRAGLAACVEGLGDLSLSLIVSTGPNINLGDLGELASNVYVEPYLSHRALLPRCDLLISHVGAGSMTAGLWCALPQLALPIGGDQHYNAELVVRLGAGERLEPGDRSPARIKEMVTQILSDQRYRNAAAAVQHEMLALPSVETGVRLLEQLAETRRPVLSKE